MAQTNIDKIKKENKTYIVNIDKEEYDICDKAAKNMWANSKKGYYGKGMLNTVEDPYKTERTGRLGEMAFGILVNQSIDDEYKHLGDTHDFFFENKKIDVKTAAKKPSYSCGLVRAETQSGKKLDLSSDIYVFGYVINDDVNKKTAQICLVGYMKKADIIKLEPKKARRGFHKNYEVHYKTLLDIGDLI